MRTYLLTTVLAALSLPLWAGEPGKTGRQGAQSPAYAGAFAHEPHFSDRSLWPAWVTKTDFYKQKWPEARVLVWKNSEKRYQRYRDHADPELWLTADGTPAKTGPDEHTDVVFPSGHYTVAGMGGFWARHVTIGGGVRFTVKTVNLHGNVWVKKGASFSSAKICGDHNTFMRNDDQRVNLIANKITYARHDEASVEWLGKWKTNDELDIFAGRFIVGPDSTFMPGDRSVQRIYPGATLVLLSGATFHKRGNQYYHDDMRVLGALLAGTPERPLRRDARLGLSFKSQGKGYEKRGSKGEHGLVLYPKGRIAVRSKDPEKARLVFYRHTMPVQSHGLEKPEEVKDMPKGISMLLLGETDFDGVAFEDVLKGGIQMRDTSARRQWKNVVFAGSNFAAPDELFAGYDGPMKLSAPREGGRVRSVRREFERGKDAEQ